jgi:hypothetical protein
MERSKDQRHGINQDQLLALLGFGQVFPPGSDLGSCGKTLPCCHSESFAVILSAAKDLALPAQDKLREESRPAHFHEHTGFFFRYAQDRLRLLRMPVPKAFPAAS